MRDTNAPERWSRAHDELSPQLQLPSEGAASAALLAIAATSDEDALRVLHALLFGMLSDPARAPRLFRLLEGCTRDFHGRAVVELRELVLDRYPRLAQTLKAQLLWILARFLDAGARHVEKLVVALLRHVACGDTSKETSWLRTNILSLLRYHIGWLHATPAAIPPILLSYLRLAAVPEPSFDEGAVQRWRDELEFCAGLLREVPDACAALGRDLILAVHRLSTEPALAPAWAELQARQARDDAAGRPGILGTPTPASALLARVSPALQQSMHHILNTINAGEHEAHVDQLDEMHLAPHKHHPAHDLLRWLCVGVHPTNAMLASRLLPRWMLGAAVIERASRAHATVPGKPTPRAVAYATLAFLFDLLGYGSIEPSVMNVEPAVLLLHHYGVPQFRPIAVGMLDGALDAATHLIPPSAPQRLQAIRDAISACVRAGVVPSIVQLRAVCRGCRNKFELDDVARTPPPAPTASSASAPAPAAAPSGPAPAASGAEGTPSPAERGKRAPGAPAPSEAGGGKRACLESPARNGAANAKAEARAGADGDAKALRSLLRACAPPCSREAASAARAELAHLLLSRPSLRPELLRAVADPEQSTAAAEIYFSHAYERAEPRSLPILHEDLVADLRALWEREPAALQRCVGTVCTRLAEITTANEPLIRFLCAALDPTALHATCIRLRLGEMALVGGAPLSGWATAWLAGTATWPSHEQRVLRDLLCAEASRRSELARALAGAAVEAACRVESARDHAEILGTMIELCALVHAPDEELLRALVALGTQSGRVPREVRCALDYWIAQAEARDDGQKEGLPHVTLATLRELADVTGVHYEASVLSRQLSLSD